LNPLSDWLAAQPARLDLPADLTGGRALPNLMPSKGPALAPVATVLADDEGDEAPPPKGEPDEDAAPWINFVVGLDDTIHRPHRGAPAPRPGTRQHSGSLGEQLAALDRAVLAHEPPLLLAADPLVRLPAVGLGQPAAPGRDPAPQVSGEILTGLLAAFLCGVLSRTCVCDRDPADRSPEPPLLPSAADKP
jgi:hypothetical protein